MPLICPFKFSPAFRTYPHIFSPFEFPNTDLIQTKISHKSSIICPFQKIIHNPSNGFLQQFLQNLPCLLPSLKLGGLALARSVRPCVAELHKGGNLRHSLRAMDNRIINNMIDLFGKPHILIPGHHLCRSLQAGGAGGIIRVPTALCILPLHPPAKQLFCQNGLSLAP